MVSLSPSLALSVKHRVYSPVKNVLAVLFLCMAIMVPTVWGQKVEAVDFVDPFIGTDTSMRPTVWEANGGTYPGAVLPFGMVQVTPENYRYSDTTIRGFSFLNHISGYPHGSAGDFIVMPVVGEALPGRRRFGSTFSHDQEAASPGYYRVNLLDYGILAELTATQRAGFCRFTFPESKNARIILTDVGEIDAVTESKITGQGNGFFFAAEWSASFDTYTASGDTLVLNYTTGRDEVILVKIGFSTSSIVGAEKNLAAEIAGWDFDAIRQQAGAIWNEHLKQIEVQGGADAQKTIFYTALYHTFLDPHLLSDLDEKEDRYASLSPWDTFRSKQPLITLLHPSRQRAMINAELMRYEQTGWLPVGPMTGNHTIPIIVDSYRKGIRGFDVEKAYQAMRKSLFEPPYGRPDIAPYLRFQYVPAEISYSVTKTLEYAYDDWALAQLADALNQTDDYQALMERAQYYRNIFNPATRFMTAKAEEGAWQRGGYREGDPWTYSWFAPHDVQGLINLMGGREAFAARLDTAFTAGFYVHDNEPPLHYAYLFNYAGQPWKTQKWVREVLDVNYTTEPGGLPGNDDLGALSAWYVFGAMGFYPVCPGSPFYAIGSPLFEEVTVHLENGKDLVIQAPGTSVQNKYVRSVRLNGVPVTRSWVTHDELLQGGLLVFEMTSEPDTVWGHTPDAAPPSMTIGRPAFELSDLHLSSHTVEADEPLILAVRVKNQGTAAGSTELRVYLDHKPYASTWVTIDSGAVREERIPFRLYEPGAHEITVDAISPQTVVVNANKQASFTYDAFTIPSPPVSKRGEQTLLQASVKNTGSFEGTAAATLYVDGRSRDTKKITLKPGEESAVTFSVRFMETGLHDVAIDSLPAQRLLIYGEQTVSATAPYDGGRLEPIALYRFDEDPGAIVRDLSGNENHGYVKGAVKWVKGLFGQALQTDASQGAYIEIPESPSFSKISDGRIMTVMAWLYPMDEQNFADVLSKGDWNVLQVRASNTEVNYYSGGYVRGEAYTTLPDNWNRHWHHVAAVSDEGVLRLYIDGELQTTKLIENDKQAGHTAPDLPWNIGRNAENPDRVFRGYIDEVKIYNTALSTEDIRRLMLYVEE